MSGLREPSPRRRQQARAAGKVAVSGPLVAAVAFAAGCATLCATARATWHELGEFMAASLTRASALAEGASGPMQLAGDLAGSLHVLWRIALPIAVVGGLAGWLCGWLQGGFLWAPGALKPDLRRLGWRSPWRRVVAHGFVHAAWMVLAIAGLATAVYWLLVTRGPAPGDLVGATGGQVVAVTGEFVRVCLLTAALVVGASGALHWGWRRHEHRRSLMMTEGDARRERRELVGHPATRTARARASRLPSPLPDEPLRVLVALDDAAVLLAYHPDVGDSPWVVHSARGPDAQVLRVNMRARRVPVAAGSMRDLPLVAVPPGHFVPRRLHARAAALMAAGAPALKSRIRRSESVPMDKRVILGEDFKSQ